PHGRSISTTAVDAPSTRRSLFGGRAVDDGRGVHSASAGGRAMVIASRSEDRAMDREVDEALSADTEHVRVSLEEGRSFARDVVAIAWTDARGAHRASVADRALVGSAPEATIRVAEPHVSRVHAELEMRPNN